MLNKTTLEKCNCKSEYQDKKYGEGIRVHNGGQNKRRCAVCGNEKSDK